MEKSSRDQSSPPFDGRNAPRSDSWILFFENMFLYFFFPANSNWRRRKGRTERSWRRRRWSAPSPFSRHCSSTWSRGATSRRSSTTRAASATRPPSTPCCSPGNRCLRLTGLCLSWSPIWPKIKRCSYNSQIRRANVPSFRKIFDCETCAIWRDMLGKRSKSFLLALSINLLGNWNRRAGFVQGGRRFGARSAGGVHVVRGQRDAAVLRAGRFHPPGTLRQVHGLRQAHRLPVGSGRRRRPTTDRKRRQVAAERRRVMRLVPRVCIFLEQRCRDVE